MSLTIGPGMTIYAGVTLNGGPAAGGTPAAASGTITIGTWPTSNYGYDTTNSAGSYTVTPNGMSGFLNSIGFSTYGGGIVFNPGTYTGNSGSIVISTSMGSASIGGSPTFTFTIDGISQQYTFDFMGSANTNSDVYGLVNKLGQTLTWSLTIP